MKWVGAPRTARLHLRVPAAALGMVRAAAAKREMNVPDWVLGHLVRIAREEL